MTSAEAVTWYIIQNPPFSDGKRIEVQLAKWGIDFNERIRIMHQIWPNKTRTDIVMRLLSVH